MPRFSRPDEAPPRVALVTGGTRNLGRAVALDLAAHDWSVAVVGGHDQAALDETLGSLRRTNAAVCGCLADFAEPGEVTKAIATCVEQLGPVTALVNNAAVTTAQPFEDLSVRDWNATLAVNLTAPFVACQAVLPDMRRRGHGRIVNISGLTAYWGMPSAVHVGASKAGLHGLTTSLASHCATDGVTVNCVVPGWLDTDRGPDADGAHAARLSTAVDRIPMRRLGTVDEVSAAVRFLLSPEASYITGQAINVSGGGHPLVAR